MRNVVKIPHLVRPLTLYTPMGKNDEADKGSNWAQITVTQETVNFICQLRERLFSDDVVEIVKQISAGFAIYSYGAKRDTDARLHVANSFCGHVTDTYFWYAEFVSDTLVTMPLDFNEFITFLNGEKKGEYWRCGDTVLRTPSQFVERFLKELRQCGETLDDFPH